jgi:hypothetical protein
MFGMTRARSERRAFTTRRGREEPHVAAESLESRLLLSASVVTYHNDAASDGQNKQETVLTPGNVNSSSFGKVFTTSVDGQVYAQPLFVPGLSIAGGVHDVLFVVTEHDSVYALDATTGAPLWQDNMMTAAVSGLPGATSIKTIPSADAFLTKAQDIQPEIGITSTPVIDLATNTLYVVASTKEIVGGVTHSVQQLFALNDLTGAERYRLVKGINTNAPATLGDTTFVNGVYANNTPIFVNGTGDGNDGHGHVFFNAARENQRAALSLVNGQLYIAWASYGDISPYHGWIAAYNPTSLALTGVLNTTPNGGLGGIWAAGGKLASDVNGNLYVTTGNGTFDGSNSGGTVTGLNAAGFPENGDYGDSFLKITIDTVHNSSSNQNINGWGLQVADYFTPFEQATLALHDRDVGSGAPLILPDSAGNSAHPHLLVGAGKEGKIYLLDRDKLGKFSASGTAESKAIVQSMPQTQLPGGEFGTPAYFNQQLYFVPTGSTTARTFSLPNGSAHITPAPASQSRDAYSWPGSTPSISANGTTNGIVWDLEHSTSQLRAYNATGYNTELYTSAQAANNRDALGSNVKFTVPTVVNGHVYVGTTNSIVAFGLLKAPAAALAQVNPTPKAAATATSTKSGTSSASTQGTSGSTTEDSSPSVALPLLPVNLHNLSAGGQVSSPIDPGDSSESTSSVPPADWPWIDQGSELDPARRFDWLFPT